MTELLLALISINILESDNHWILLENHNLNNIQQNLIPCIDDYRRDLEMITKHKFCIKEQRQKINQSMEILEKDIFQIELNCNQTFQKMLGIIDEIHIEKCPLKEIQIEQFIDEVQNLQNKYWEIVGSDAVHNGLDGAIMEADKLIKIARSKPFKLN